jgi:NitT/TauT family transport system permease protein
MTLAVAQKSSGRARAVVGSRTIMPAILVGASILLLWEVLVRTFSVPIYILPAPSRIASTIVGSFDLLAVNAAVTLQEIIIGFGLSICIGIPLAMAIVYSRLVEQVAFPLMVSLQTIPKVALAPIIIMWLGYGLLPKVLVAFLISFFPIVISAVVGLRSTPRELIHLVRSMGADEWTIFTKIRLPKALPSIFGGLRIGIGQAVIGATVGEFIAAEGGLGYLQLVAQSRFEIPLLFASVVVLSLVGVALFHLVGIVERLTIPWSRRTSNMDL